MHIHCLSHFHVRYGLVKAQDHLPGAAHKFQRLPAVVGRIELGPIIEGSPVMGAADFSYIASGKCGSGAASPAAATSAPGTAGMPLFVAAAAVSLFMVTAAVPVLVMVMVAVCAGGHQLAFQVGFHRLVRIPLGACAHFNARLGESCLGSAAKAAADQHVDGTVSKKPCQRAMSDPVGTDHFAGDHLVVLYFIHLKLLCSSKMLKDVSVIICYSYFHLFNSPVSYSSSLSIINILLIMSIPDLLTNRIPTANIFRKYIIIRSAVTAPERICSNEPS